MCAVNRKLDIKYKIARQKHILPPHTHKRLANRKSKTIDNLPFVFVCGKRKIEITKSSK